MLNLRMKKRKMRLSYEDKDLGIGMCFFALCETWP